MDEQAWMQDIRPLVGKEYGRVYAWDKVNAPMIRQWCEVMGVDDKSYLVEGAVIAPPAMLQPGPAARPSPPASSPCPPPPQPPPARARRRAALLAAAATAALPLLRPLRAAAFDGVPQFEGAGAAFDSAAASVVAVVGAAGDAAPPSAAGTGVVVAPRYVLTTSALADAIAATRAPSVVAADSRRLRVSVAAADGRRGVALLSVPDLPDTPAIAFARSAAARPGSPLFSVVASPSGGPPSLAGAGVLSGASRAVSLAGTGFSLIGALQTDAGAAPGAPVVDASGALVGLGVAPALADGDRSAPDGIGFALPADTLKGVVARLLGEAEAKRDRA